MKDQFDREITYLRVSITDRCNLRCRYCMPEDGVCKVSHQDILRYEEILEIVAMAAELGVKKVRVTGGRASGAAGLCGLMCRDLEHFPAFRRW